MYYVYILKSLSVGICYVGQTNNLERRLRQHNEGKASYASHRGPFKLIHTETFETRSEAVRREKYFKTGKGREEIKFMGH